MGQTPAVYVVGTFTKKIEHLRKGQRNDEVIGLRGVGDHEKGCRPFIAHAVKLQLVIAHNLPELGDVKGGQTCAAAYQDRLGRFAAA